MSNDVSAPVNWSEELKGAAMLVKSGLVSKDIRSAESALFVILAGRDLGLSPVQSLRGIRPIQGKLELSADLQLGLYHRAGGKSQWLKITDSEAELKLLAPWSIEPHVSRFTLEDARRADLLSNPTWRKYPKAMLRSRAITQGLKDVGFLAGAGVYAPGELGGAVTIDQATGEVVPGEEGATQRTEVSPTAGVVEALDDGKREELTNIAGTITRDVEDKAIEAALNQWNALENDDKVAVWALLDKSTRKSLKHAQEAARAIDPPSEMDIVRSVRADIAVADYDGALDKMRQLPEPVREVLRKEMIEAQMAGQA